ncbi:MAG: helix-turn-helix domain-containing protein [Enhydrobacter sp.]|nr:helix-turn-helix domain-containing protein [Enhydrobacter sp.]
MNVRVSENRAVSLGAFLRAMRERQEPADHGLPRGSRRRTPGLRREEVAQLCGLSVTWCTWIEQGRDVSVSAQALARLARGLRLSRAERSYLFELAGKHDPDRWGSVDQPSDAMLACVDAINGPAYVLDRNWTALRWNARASRLFAGWLDAGGERNLLRYVFLRRQSRSLIVDWDSRAHRVVAEFRAATTGRVGDPELRSLVDELSVKSADFSRLWSAHGVLAREGGERTFRHPVDGVLHYRQVSMSFAGWPDYRLTMLLAMPGTARVRKTKPKPGSVRTMG